ncbi:MAG: pilus assembly protein PilM [Vicinamibacterales bacterium]
MSSYWYRAAAPRVAVEIGRRRINVVAVDRTGTGTVIDAYASEPLPDGAVTPALGGTNVPDTGVVADALRRALDRAGLGSTSRAALVVPDSVARVTLLPFEQMPARAADLDQLVRWQLRKATPFPLDEAVVGHVVANRAGGQTTLAAVAARRDVMAQYEAVAAAAGLHAGIVDLASFNVMNAVIGAGAAPAADWLLVHLAADATTLAILRGEDLMFYRHRPAVDQEPLSALVHQTAMYHEDRLGGDKFARVWLCGAASTAEHVRSEIAERLGVPAESVDVRPAAAFRQEVSVSSEILDALAPSVGVLLRERKAA